MLLPRFVAGIFSIGLTVVGAGVSSGQNYPNKPIRLVTSEVGGSADFASRLIARGLSDALGQQVIVDNRPSGVIPGEIVAKAPPDGYVLLLAGGVFWVGPLLQKTPYDPISDFSPITLTNSAPNVLIVNPSLPAKSVKELIALAKAKPGELNYASPSVGSSPHLAAELFKSMAGVDIVHIPFRGNAPGILAMISGQVQLTFATPGAAGSHIKTGKVRALAVTSAQRSALFADLPTVASSGLPGYESMVWLGMFSPAKTPVTIINRLRQEVVRILNQTDVKKKFFNTGVEVVGSSPEEFSATIKAEVIRIGKLIKDAGIRAN